MRWFGWLATFVVLSSLVNAQDAQLSNLRVTLLEVQKRKDEHQETRGATPQLTVVKHQLRDWVESQLKRLPHDGDEVAFAQELNAELKSIAPSCEPAAPDGQNPCEGENQLGLLGEVKLHGQSGLLVLQTGVGILCGGDGSAYLYEWSQNSWQRRWESEQNVYIEKHYAPQTIHSVLVSPANKDKSRLVLTLGSEPWCSSNLHDVYYRLWRIKPGRAVPELLINAAEWARIDNDPPIRATLKADEVLVEFIRVAIDPSPGEVTRRYRIAQRVRRVDPVALRPNDFVNEWLQRPWEEIVRWSQQSSASSLRQVHQRLHTDTTIGSFLFPTTHCRERPHLWQVGLMPYDAKAPDKEGPVTYFLVRFQPPNRFAMIQATDHPSPDCTEDDPAADEKPFFQLNR